MLFFIGQNYGGGIIFYIDGTGQHGLIAAPSDQSAGVEWGCYPIEISEPMEQPLVQETKTQLILKPGVQLQARPLIFVQIYP